MTDVVELLRQGSLTRDDYRWKAADEIEEMRAVLKPFAAAADIVVPHIDILCGNGFYESLLKAKAVLNEGAK